MDFNQILWNQMKSRELKWNLMKSNEIEWHRMESRELERSPMKSNEGGVRWGDTFSMAAPEASLDQGEYFSTGWVRGRWTLPKTSRLEGLRSDDLASTRPEAILSSADIYRNAYIYIYMYIYVYTYMMRISGLPCSHVQLKNVTAPPWCKFYVYVSICIYIYGERHLSFCVRLL